MSGHEGLDVLDELRDRITVGPAPVTAILAGARSRRRRRRRATALGTAAAVALVAATVVVAAGSRQPEPPDVVVDVPLTELALPWWSEGVLHVGGESVEIEDVTNLVETSSGAVVATSDGVVHTVVDGEVTAVGRKQGLPAFVVDPVRGWVAWADPDHELVVLDPRTGEEVARRMSFQNGLDTTEFPIVLEDGVLTYDNRFGNRVWDIDAGTQRRLGDGATYLLAQRGDLQLVMADGMTGAVAVLRTGQETWRPSVVASVASWAWSPDRGHLLGITTSGDAHAWDADTGRPQETGLPGGSAILSAAFLGSGGIAYSVPDDGAVDLVVCGPPGPGASCTTVVDGVSDLVLPDTFWLNPPLYE